jgi:NAD(P)-dependent dehydrogenase (short-subunit alcohol dehydrogenase family)
MSKKLTGKVAAITGGSRGIGPATAKRFVEEGAHAFIAERSQQELDRAMTTIGKNVSGVLTDVSKLDDIANLYRTVVPEKRKIDIVFAGFEETQGNSRRHPRAFRQNLRYQRAQHLFHRTLAFAFCCRCKTGTLASGASCSKGIAPREADICR